MTTLNSLRYVSKTVPTDADGLIIYKDTDGEFVALKLQNNSDAANTTGKVSVEFDLEDTSGNEVDAGKITVVKKQSFTNTASTQDSTMEFYTSVDGGFAKVCDFTSDQHVEIQGGLKIGTGDGTSSPYSSYGSFDDSGSSSSDAMLKQLFIQHPMNYGTGANDNDNKDNGWWIGNQADAITATDGDLNFGCVRYGTMHVAGIIQDSNGKEESITMNHTTFTGQHRCIGNSGMTAAQYGAMIGYIVRADGKYNNISDNGTSANINESLPVIELSDSDNDKRVFGVISSHEDNEREYQQGTFVSVYDIPKDDERVIINSLGEGAVWVTNINGNLENGDYITTSTAAGLGQKQDDDILHSYTVAKITQDCDFSGGTDFEHNGQTYKKQFVGCTYHCG